MFSWIIKWFRWRLYRRHIERRSKLAIRRSGVFFMNGTNYVVKLVSDNLLCIRYEGICGLKNKELHEVVSSVVPDEIKIKVSCGCISKYGTD